MGECLYFFQISETNEVPIKQSSRRRLPPLPEDNSPGGSGSRHADQQQQQPPERKTTRAPLKFRSASADVKQTKPILKPRLADDCQSSTTIDSVLVKSRSMPCQQRPTGGPAAPTPSASKTTAQGSKLQMSTRIHSINSSDDRRRQQPEMKPRSKSAEENAVEQVALPSLKPRSLSAGDKRIQKITWQDTSPDGVHQSCRRGNDDNRVAGRTKPDDEDDFWKDSDDTGTVVRNASSKKISDETAFDPKQAEKSGQTKDEPTDRETSLQNIAAIESKSDDVDISHQIPVAKARPKIPPKPPRTKIETPPPPSVVCIYGVDVPKTFHSLQQRIKDEIKIVTATKRLRIDEAEEIRMMEAEMAERSRERKLRNQQEAERNERQRLADRSAREMQASNGNTEAEHHQSVNIFGQLEQRCGSKHPVSASVHMYAEQLPLQHKRHTSDPLFDSFSMADEGQYEGVGDPFQYHTLPTSSRYFSDLPDPKQIKLGTSVLTQKKVEAPSNRSSSCSSSSGGGRNVTGRGIKSRSSQVLHLDDDTSDINANIFTGSRLASTSLPVMFGDENDCAMYGIDVQIEENEKLRKQEKLQRLQIEIEKRRKHLQEMIAIHDAQIKRDELFLAKLEASERYTKVVSPQKVVPHQKVVPPQKMHDERLIKPIDYQINPEMYFVKPNQLGAASVNLPLQKSFMAEHLNSDLFADDYVFSSHEYLAHKTVQAIQNVKTTPRSTEDGGQEEEFYCDDYQKQSEQSEKQQQQPMPQSSYYVPIEKDGGTTNIRYSESEDSLMYCPATYGSSRDSGVSSSMTGTDTYPLKSDRELTPPPSYDDLRIVGEPGCGGGEVGSRRAGRQKYRPAEYGNSVLKDITPAMPILDDVTSRSRNLLRDIGSRPLSDDFEKYFRVEGEEFHFSKMAALWLLRRVLYTQDRA